MKEPNSHVIDCLNDLNKVEKVEVEVSKKKRTIQVRCLTERSLDFKLFWSYDHFVGYFMDGEGQLSQAVIALWNPLDAAHFAAAYSLLVPLRASRREH